MQPKQPNPLDPTVSPSLPVPQFFVDHKKGEVNELRVHLRAVALEKDQNKKRDVIKKVIAYMTLGIDVSRLYPEMVKASRTDDIVMKKMIYLYLTNYAEQNQELAILAINTFLIDIKGTDSKIRGLALRSLCQLKFEGVTEYMQQAIDICLSDVDSYVKKTAIIGCVKLFHMDKSAFKKNTTYLEKLQALTTDNDSLVVINAIEAINEIRADKGGIEITRTMVINLLNRIRDFNEWGQSVILDMCAKYTPTSTQERYDIMNLLEDRFKHASSSVVLGAIKVFLHITDHDPELAKKVYMRMQAPLITLMTSAETTESYEVSYNVLSHIHLLVNRGANFVFESEYKQFFVKYDEPSYIKNLKLEILAQVASVGNIQEIMNELSEYVTDVNAEIAKKSIKCFGTIIIRL
jgi:AP-4 complex subunit beta-1